MIRTSTIQTFRTLRSTREYPGLLRFLIGRIFYTDSINTVILVMGLFTVNVAVASGLSEEDGKRQAKIILLFAITFAVIGGFVWGWLTDRQGPKRTLNWVLGSWVGIFVVAALLGICGWPLWVMYGVAAWAGFSLGGVWAADRPYILRLTPPWRIGEFYGLYGMVGRFSAIVGPVIWGLVIQATNRVLSGGVLDFLPPKVNAEITRVSQGVGMLALLVMIVVSYLILKHVSDQPRAWEPQNSKQTRLPDVKGHCPSHDQGDQR